jgi:UTP-glucose-1-phosphate uridylyltransferase
MDMTDLSEKQPKEMLMVMDKNLIQARLKINLNILKLFRRD